MPLRVSAWSLFGRVKQIVPFLPVFRKSAALPPSPSPLSPTLKDPSEAIGGDGELSSLEILHWRSGLTPTLRGRDREVEAILSWATAKNSLDEPSARLISGPGGAGKTRLAADVAMRLDKQGWSAGFLEEGQVLANLDRPRFLIIDYPEEKPKFTEDLLHEILAAGETAYPVRFLLLSRREHKDWETWVHRLGAARFGRQDISQPAALSADDVWSLIEEAILRLSKLLGKPPEAALRRAEMETWLATDPQTHGLPLYAMATAVHAVIDPKHAYTLARGDLLLALADRELRRVQGMSDKVGLGKAGLSILFGLAVIGNGLTVEKCVPWLGTTPIPATPWRGGISSTACPIPLGGTEEAGPSPPSARTFPRWPSCAGHFFPKERKS
ncbi:MAG: ATP-binding protein [Rhodospirillum sp.]|nr:ATP-binding protein [Rhodospirillum sp.]MCF8487690.1 ATP-binding protein [Rhodospirillum sp.]MCF8499586.1 ATP-binding protein [Rhodospirillum sp.]